MPSPRVFIIRHGETTWSISGRHTSTTNIPLTPAGEKRVLATGRALVGNDRLIVPSKLSHIYVSPRLRAQRTLELLNIAYRSNTPGLPPAKEGGIPCEAKVEITEDIREWDYGEYEGITSPEINEIRKEKGIDGGKKWDIWRDGCPGGESPADITARLDRLISEIRERYHRPVMEGDGKDDEENLKGDILIVAHGHILRAFAQRWAGRVLHDGPSFLLEAGGVGTLSYEHHNIDEPAILLGGAFTVGHD
ncbi:histidine phosphatase superfamily [Triangularia verruculosa]|uniref:Histidine phosphatase superfamily n=1 Tax=Triangularia verruculosa TaxID=2587418 RepID=A0AAN6XLX2_9PEZI|nr:histidine phosphatase superfamily [Triangularia verruculosa]